MTQFVTIDRATLEQLVMALNNAEDALNNSQALIAGRERLGFAKTAYAANENALGFVSLALTAGRAALANAEPTGWQKIETAPKDGSFYLAFGEGKTWIQNQPNGCYPGEWHFSESRGEWRGYSLTDEATNWMPLPAPLKDTL